ncbi:MAG: PAS domain S-box protein [Planctomycetes bacterium]|nr:PAS domain S-box protein [Planctomycetota bacterium]
MAKQRPVSGSVRPPSGPRFKVPDPSDKDFGLIFEEAADAIFVAGPDHKLLDTNPAATRLLGYTREEFLKLSVHDLAAPEELANVEMRLEQLDSGKNLTYPRKMKCKDGSIVITEISARKIPDGRVLAIVRELTEREQARLALKRSEQQLRTVVESALDCVVGMDHFGCITEWNPAAERTFGHAREEVLGKPLADVIIPARLRDMHRQGLARFLATGEGPVLGKRIEQVVLRGDGTEFPVELSITTMHREGEQPQFTGFLRDITDRRRAEDALRASEARYRALVRNSADAVQILGPDGRIVYVSDAVERVLGYKPAELVGIVAMGLVHPDDSARGSAELADLAQRPGAMLTDTVRVKRKDGRWRWMECNVTNAIHEPAIGGMVVNYRDVTERFEGEEALRAAEARYRKLVNYSNDGLLMGDAQGNTQFASPSVENILGFAAGELIGVNVFSLIHPDDQSRTQELQQLIVRSPSVGFPATFRVKRKDGRYVWVDCVCTNWLAEPGINALVANFRDITARIELEQQLQQAVKMDAIGRLAGGVAHDFNNLLTAITGFTQMLIPRLASDALGKNYASQVAQAADRAAALTRQLLAFSRRQILQPVVLDLNARVHEIEKLIRRLIGEDIELNIVTSSNLNSVAADPGQVDQVLMNLAVNARDAMPRGGRLTIETANVTLDEAYARMHKDCRPGPYVMLAVSDTGVGMDAPTRARLFEPFFTTKEKGQGTGLGLATVYGIVKQSGGNIWVYSEVGHGTTFKIYLPATQVESEAASQQRPSPAAGGSETILVAEDEDGVRALICEALIKAGYTVFGASNGQKALVLSTTLPKPPQLLLTDVVMPEMGGRALAEALAVRHPGMKILFMSGYTDEAIFHNGTLNGGVQFLHKPFTPDALLHRVREVLDGK